MPKDRVDEFKSIKKFKVFNTNNLWASLEAIDRLVSDSSTDFEVIANKKVRLCNNTGGTVSGWCRGGSLRGRDSREGRIGGKKVFTKRWFSLYRYLKD